jgi:hypothetical protein
MQISDYGVWTETAKGEEWISKEKAVSELLSIPGLIFITFYVCM